MGATITRKVNDANLSGLTTERTLRFGERRDQGSDGAYYGLTTGPGEPHLRRLELAPHALEPERRTSLLHVVQITDLHIVDAESPGRFEFVDRFHGHEALHLLLPSYRPQEVLQPYACDAMIATATNIAGSPVTGAPVQCLLCSGDYTDNAQLNELSWVMGILAGATVTPGSGGRAYEGVAATSWGDPAYWHPDSEADEYKRRWGFPTYPGLLDDIRRPFQAHGVTLPWLSCRGNHDALIQGTARFNPAFERILTAARKARSLPEAYDVVERLDPSALLAQLDHFIEQPELFLSGPSSAITPDAERRHYGSSAFVKAHLQIGGEPHGHGYADPNMADGTAYYVDDRHPPVRIVALDTVNPGGNYQGSIGATQLSWLERRLAEVHSRYWDVQGRAITTQHEDRLVVVISHHGLASLVNDLVAPGVENDAPRVLGPELAALLHRFPNVILWVNGHTHRNTVRPLPDPTGRSAGFWEVTTSSLLDWPCQARLIEVVSNGNGTLSVFCTMVDHSVPLDPWSAGGTARLAAIHRELAANDPHAGIASGMQGQPSDRNVELILPEPFALR